MAKIHGGQVLARALRNEGVDMVFTLTGGHIMGFLDGCVLEGIRVVDVRHEQTAAHAAEAWTRLTGRLGVAAVTAGPGVTDAITGVATAHASGTPMLLLGGRHLVRQELMGGLQEMDHPRLFGSITAWAGTGWQADRLAETVATAVRHAWAGRGGPVFLDVPMDVQLDQVEESAVLFPSDSRPNRPTGASTAVLDEVAGLLARAGRPLVFAGGGYREVPGERTLEALAESLGAPVFTNSRARGCLPPDHPLLGNHARSALFGLADVVVALGVDWDFRAGYGRSITGTVVQVDADPTRIGWNRAAHIGVVADPATFVGQLIGRPEMAASGRDEWVGAFCQLEESLATEKEAGSGSDDAPVHPQRFAAEVADFFGDDALVAVDGGDIVSTTARALRISTPGHLLDPGPFGSLGTGPGYAIAAQLAFPDRRVGLVFGDGAFGFNGFEYDTMVRHGLPVVGVLGNDGVWSNIKTVHQAFFPDRVVATDLGRRPYAAVVTAMGGHGEVVTDPADIRPALDRAAASRLPALVEVHIAETRRMSSNYAQ
jgi:acetolactate synthase I/II/III large subunit